MQADTSNSHGQRQSTPSSSKNVPGRIALFGFSTTDAEIQVLPRSLSWRIARASAFLGGAILLTPFVGVVPPHAPWVVGALGLGGWLGHRKWEERYTVLSFRGLCPKCGGELSISPGTPLREVMSLSCEECHYDSRMTVDFSDLTSEGRAVE